MIEPEIFRRVLRAGLVLVGFALSACGKGGTEAGHGVVQDRADGQKWLSAWGTTWEFEHDYSLPIAETTVRNIARITAGGTAVRIRFFNLDPDKAVTIGSAAVGIRLPGAEAALVPGSNRVVTFDGGQASVVIPPNTESYYSDPVAIEVASQDDLAVSLYVMGSDNALQFGTAWNESYRVPGAGGNSTLDESGEGFGLIDGAPEQFPAGTPIRCNGCRPYVMRDIEVLTTEASGVMAFLGSSSFHGANTLQNAFKRVTDLISLRIRDELPAGEQHTVVNRAISGDTLLNAVNTRLERDVWSTRGLRSIVVWVTNDLEDRTADEVIATYRELIEQARSRGVMVFCPTWLPGAQNLPASFDGERSKLNDWILHGGECDGVVDWNAVVEAPGGFTFLPQYNSGDSVHANDAGHAAWAAVTPIAEWIGLSQR